MKVAVLGSAEAALDDGPIDLGTRKQRALVAALALHRGRPVAVDSIVDMLWPDGAPAGVAGTLQAYVAGLRRALEPTRAARAPSTVLLTVAPGYALRLGVDDLDAAAFDEAVGRAHRRLRRSARPLDGSDLPPAELTAIHDDFDAALALWRGTPYLELEDADSAVAERARLEELRLVALEGRVIAAMGLGQHATAVAELESLTAAHPLRERLWALRALALTRSGRQADALDVLRRVRTVLDDELGLDPGQELRDLQAAILRQDPALEWRPPATAPDGIRTDGVAARGATEAGATVGDLATAAPATRAGTAAPYIPPLPPWPLVGRDRELAALVDALGRADAGEPAFASLVGDPGIGKTRLGVELLAVARERGALVLVGRCSQDDGAPPLWPWQQVLGGLGQGLPQDSAEDGGAGFRTWEAIVGAILEAARWETVVVALDDLHWADAASLRVLRLLTESASSARLLVVATWRAHPEPTGALADVAETLARRHAVRLDLVGLTAEQVGAVVGAVAEAEPTAAEASALQRRTDGNPFFLVEYARLAREGGDLAALLADPHAPSAVHDVLTRRLDRLPAETVAVLRAASVIGREFDLATLAVTLSGTLSGTPSGTPSGTLPGSVSGTTEADEDVLLDHLDVAVAAGLAREDGVDRFRFSHALVRDTAYGGLARARRARAHARVARALTGRPGRETEVALHWAAAGPGHASRAWVAALAASDIARRLHAHDEAATLLESALESLALDPDGTPLDRYALLADLADAQRWAGDWAGLTASAEAAIAVADEVADVELLGRAAMMTAVGALWQSGPHGGVNEVVVDALRRSLDGLPREDSPLRCRVMLSLALEVYYTASLGEREALVEEGLAMARRLGDNALLLDAFQLAYVALWCQRHAVLRLTFATEGMALAHRLGNERAYVVTTTLAAVVSGELGRVEEMWEHAALARDRSEELRLPYGLMVVDSLELPWLAMAGRFEEAEAQLAHIVALHQRMSLPQGDDAAAGALMTLRIWQGRAGELKPMMLGLAESTPLPVSSTVAVYLLRGGLADEARAHLAEHPVDLSSDDWFSMLDWCLAAEAALGVGDPDLAARTYALLAPWAGRSCCAGSGNAMGPVDAFLALAAAATGETEIATRHADRALELCEEWRIPLVATWLRGLRDLHGF